MHHTHHWVFVGLSLLVAILGSWTALALFQRVRTHEGVARFIWLALASSIMGAGIWSIHFIAMLGFDPGSPVSYDLPLTGLSLLMAIAGTALAFLVASRGRGDWPRLAVASLAMGLAICAMHYVGMAALRTAASLGYRSDLVLASVMVAVIAAFAALWAARDDRSLAWRAGAAGVLGLAIVGMHYTAMAAVVLTPGVGAGPPASGVPPIMLAIAVATGSLMIFVTALVASVQDQRQALLGVMDAGGVGYWEYHPRSGRLMASDQARKLVGLTRDQPIDPETWRARLSPAARAQRDQQLRHTLETGEDYEARYLLASGAWISLRGRAVKDRSGKIVKIAGVMLDVTDRERAAEATAQSERRQRLLINELNHRVKNTLATILAMAELTARRARSVELFVADFRARLLALSSTHNLLTAQGWENAGLRGLLELELKPYAAEQVTLSGGDVTLPAEQALAVGLVVHELTTNAVKYGALSTPDGMVIVGWGFVDDELVLEWREEGGPSPSLLPGSEGFGSKLIKTSVEAALQGRLERRYGPGGLELRIAFIPVRAVFDDAAVLD